MAYTETTRTSYGKRLGNSLGGIVTGLLLFVGGTVLIWWNEAMAVELSPERTRPKWTAVPPMQPVTLPRTW